MSQATIYKLKVISGIHKDAELALDEGMTYLIGSGDTCDIILCDSGVEAEHFSFYIQDDTIILEKKADLYADGRKVPEGEVRIAPFQVITLGEAHIAMGSTDTSWPVIDIPEINTADEPPVSYEIVPVPKKSKPPQKKERGVLIRAFVGAYLFLVFNKKSILVMCIFTAILTLFIIDVWRSIISVNHTIAAVSEEIIETKKTDNKSVLLTAVNTIRDVHHETMVGTGFKEPAIPVQNKAVFFGNPEQRVRAILKENWGNNLTETESDDQTIQFKGYDDKKKMDLILNLSRGEEGEIQAQGYTLSKKKRRKIHGALADIVRVKMESTEEMEDLCKRVLKKKGIKRPSAQFKMESKTVTLKGEAKTGKTLLTIREIMQKAFSDIKVKNQIQISQPKVKKINITGVSTSGMQYVTLDNGSRVFKGGELKNGCTIEKIEANHIIMNCKGQKVTHNIGG